MLARVGIFLCALLAITGSAKSQETSESADAMSLPPVLMHYMPWFNWSRKKGSAGYHWKENLDWNVLLKDQRIASHYTPAIGPYNSVDRDVIRYHLELMVAAGVKGIIVNWYGTRDHYDFRTNLNASNAIIEEASKMGLLFTVCYEDWTLVSGSNPKVERGHEPTGDVLQAARERLRDDLVYIRDNYTSKPGFLREDINGRPVMLIFGPRHMKTGAEWTEAMSEVFIDAHNRPKLLTLKPGIADGTFSWFPSMKREGSLDGQQETLSGVHEYLRSFYAQNEGTLHIGSIFPGFHDYYKVGRNGTSHGLIPEYSGYTFEASMYQAKKNRPTFIQAATWNDWEEGTTIEPRENKPYYFLLKLQKHILGVHKPDDFTDIYEAYKAKKGDDFGWPSPSAAA